jgi:hypothetical protein
MQVEILKSKVHTATITEANLEYVGSLTLRWRPDGCCRNDWKWKDTRTKHFAVNLLNQFPNYQIRQTLVASALLILLISWYMAFVISPFFFIYNTALVCRSLKFDDFKYSYKRKEVQNIPFLQMAYKRLAMGLDRIANQLKNKKFEFCTNGIAYRYRWE